MDPQAANCLRSPRLAVKDPRTRRCGNEAASISRRSLSALGTLQRTRTARSAYSASVALRCLRTSSVQMLSCKPAGITAALRW